MMEKLPEQKINRSRNHRMSEYRKANIVYFLSRNGVVEHPHLIRVHHLHNSGVHLRDVKRWLVELRGKEMPDSFAWSYKRKYRSGYIWEDIKNDDLITPISDNEYVLKGSYLLSHALDGLHVGDQSDKKEKIFDEEENRKPKECESVLVEKEEETNLPETQPKLDTTNRMEKPKQKSNNQKKRITLLEIDASKIITIPEDKEKVDAPQVCRSYSSKASTVFRNILSCRKADADESALHHGETRSRRRSTSELPDQSSRKSMSGNGHYKPAGAPNCSLCGKAFKPGKMVSHMKTCEGLIGRGKQRMDTTTEKIPLRRRESRHSFSDHF